MTKVQGIVYDRPTRPDAVPTLSAPVTETKDRNDAEVPPKPWWKKFKEAFAGESIDYELTK